MTHFEEYGHYDHTDEEKEELFDEPAGPQYQLAEAHHLHGLTNPRLLLDNQLLWGGWREDVLGGHVVVCCN